MRSLDIRLISAVPEGPSNPGIEGEDLTEVTSDKLLVLSRDGVSVVCVACSYKNAEFTCGVWGLVSNNCFHFHHRVGEGKCVKDQ